MKAIILAAGIGSRLGKPHPKPLTVLNNGYSIMQTQIDNLLKYVDIHDIYVVVGFKKELIMEEFPKLTFVYNNYFDSTNTSKSLLKALEKIEGHDILWMNGDVVCDHHVIGEVAKSPYSSMAVNTDSVAEEEVKYTTNEQGYINQVSKEVSNALGEAVGVNKVIAKDLSLFIQNLRKCNDDDYFERGIEMSIKLGMCVKPIDISNYLCTEVDFEDDLNRVNDQLSTKI